MSSNPSQPSSVFLYTQTTVENEGTETTQAQTVVPRSSHRLAPHADFIQFLALCQKLKTPFRLLDRHDGLDSLGEGGQGAISQSLYNSDISFAYKRTTLAGTAQDTETREGLLYDIWTTELWVLQKLSIVKHPNLVALQGLALEVHVETPGQTDRFSVQPVLMFEKAKYGSLPNFMRTNREWIPWEIRVHICASIGMAVAILHELGTSHEVSGSF
ncbi:hypothetical protein K491DRAFT_690438 [Lophiostoma macrostomum CBS 122681]|uniref:Protein kinase domain-containing protein n=1 Tax=Lophiostoma macrostomum CBS 122681 TaxID=1314788 RepID=A0A6A6TDL2_9PLEO|nr:hypothetical protein K491DRAFT_690438 [Lophiostoma macrostomum CBS 122681]